MSVETDFDYDEYEKRRIESAKEQGLRFVPETGPKVFCVACSDGVTWNEIHNYIINENEIDGIPNRKIDCTDDCKCSDRMASYEMSDAEADQLKLHSKVASVHLDPDYYEGTFKGAHDRITSTTNRYGSNVKIGRDFGVGEGGVYVSDFFPTTPGSSLLSRTGASIYRHQQKDDPWDGIADTTILDANPSYRGDGTDVDVIVCDTSAWYGHVEFVKTEEDWEEYKKTLDRPQKELDADKGKGWSKDNYLRYGTILGKKYCNKTQYLYRYSM